MSYCCAGGDASVRYLEPFIVSLQKNTLAYRNIPTCFPVIHISTAPIYYRFLIIKKRKNIVVAVGHVEKWISALFAASFVATYLVRVAFEADVTYVDKLSTACQHVDKMRITVDRRWIKCRVMGITR